MITLYDLYQHQTAILIFLILLAVWDFVWRGMALWYAGKHRQKKWFITLLVANSLGLLPIIYLWWYKPRPIILPQHSIIRTVKRRR